MAEMKEIRAYLAGVLDTPESELSDAVVDTVAGFEPDDIERLTGPERAALTTAFRGAARNQLAARRDIGSDAIGGETLRPEDIQIGLAAAAAVLQTISKDDLSPAALGLISACKCNPLPGTL